MSSNKLNLEKQKRNINFRAGPCASRSFGVRNSGAAQQNSGAAPQNSDSFIISVESAI